MQPATERATPSQQAKSDDLVTRARNGDGAAWEELYRQAYQRLTAFAYNRLRSVEDAQDAVSETISRAIAQVHRYKGPDDLFVAWLFGILRHVVADHQRDQAKRGRHRPPEDVELPVDPAELLAAHAERAAVRRALARLDADEQELLLLRAASGLRSEEVAAAVGKKPSAVRMAQKRALARLRVFLEEELHED